MGVTVHIHSWKRMGVTHSLFASLTLFNMMAGCLTGCLRKNKKKDKKRQQQIWPLLTHYATLNYMPQRKKVTLLWFRLYLLHLKFFYFLFIGRIIKQTWYWHKANLPENPGNIILSWQIALIISGWSGSATLRLINVRSRPVTGHSGRSLLK